MTNSAKKRADAFVSAFIRNESLCPSFGASSDDWLHDPERMERCQNAAVDGEDGSTHAEIINDWREAFARFLRSRGNRFDRFEAAVLAHFDALEAWHEANDRKRAIIVECPKCGGAGFTTFASQGNPDRLVDVNCEVCEGNGSLNLTDVTEVI